MVHSAAVPLSGTAPAEVCTDAPWSPWFRYFYGFKAKDFVSEFENDCMAARIYLLRSERMNEGGFP